MSVFERICKDNGRLNLDTQFQLGSASSISISPLQASTLPKLYAITKRLSIYRDLVQSDRPHPTKLRK